jgi:hypothetical protein
VVDDPGAIDAGVDNGINEGLREDDYPVDTAVKNGHSPVEQPDDDGVVKVTDREDRLRSKISNLEDEPSTMASSGQPRGDDGQRLW